MRPSTLITHSSTAKTVQGVLAGVLVSFEVSSPKNQVASIASKLLN